jgi:hypothetical protein
MADGIFRRAELRLLRPISPFQVPLRWRMLLPDVFSIPWAGLTSPSALYITGVFLLAIVVPFYGFFIIQRLARIE